MKRPVMVALDGSDKDKRALAVGQAVARLSGGDLHFVRVIGDPGHDLRGAPPLQALQDVEAERAEVERDLAGVIASLPLQGNQAVTHAVLQSRDVAATLIQHAVERDALVVVLATRAPGARARVLAGSVADHVMRECARPVILVPPGAGFLAGKEPRIARVMVPMDGSTLSFRSLEFMVGLPRAMDVEYVLLEVVPDEGARRAADARLRASAAWLRSRGLASVEVCVVVARDPAAAIVNEVREALPELIAMSTRGAGGLARLALGSVAEGVVRNSELPVMLLTSRMLSAPHSD